MRKITQFSHQQTTKKQTKTHTHTHTSRISQPIGSMGRVRYIYQSFSLDFWCVFFMDRYIYSSLVPWMATWATCQPPSLGTSLASRRPSLCWSVSEHAVVGVSMAEIGDSRNSGSGRSPGMSWKNGGKQVWEPRLLGFWLGFWVEVFVFVLFFLFGGRLIR